VSVTRWKINVGRIDFSDAEANTICFEVNFFTLKLILKSNIYSFFVCKSIVHQSDAKPNTLNKTKLIELKNYKKKINIQV